MRNFFTTRNVILLIGTLLLWSAAQAQFETIFGNLDGPEDMADIKSLSNGHSVILGNTTSYGPQKILLAELSEIGEVEWYRTIQDIVNSDIEFTGKGLELAVDSSGGHNGYFITGCQGNYLSQMIVIRTDLNGSPLWTLNLYNTERHDTLEECGISLERQSNGDVIAVGTSANYATGNNRFIVTRLTSSGEIVWTNRYGSVQGLQFYPNESCNGFRSAVPVIAVVGRVQENEQGNTFLSCIRANTGLELWRRRYDSNGYQDEGNDVVQNPSNQRFIVVGQIDSVEGHSTMWVFNANVLNGTLINGTEFRQADGNLVATDVCLGMPSSSALIVGRRDSVFHGPSTFAMRLPFTAGASPVWNYYYGYSSPNTLGDDAVDRYTFSTPGHYVVGSLGNGADFYVAEIPVDGDELCSGIPFGITSSPAGHSESLNKHRTAADDWTQYGLSATDQIFSQFLCWPAGTEFNPLISEEESRELAVSVYPNPIYAGELVQIGIQLPEPMEIELQLIDINSGQYETIREYREAGLQTFAMRIPGASFTKVYSVKVTLSNGQQKVIKLVANL